MFKDTSCERYVFCAVKAYGSSGTANPSLIVELVVAVRTVHLWAKLVGFCHIHSCLQWRVSTYRGAHPCGIAERYALKCYVFHRIIGCAFHFEQSFHSGYNNFCLTHVLAFTWYVIYL